ncbi:MAG: ATP-binding protein [Anaerolineae bacterium]
MRCRKCSDPAVINMRHHKLALCGQHYAEWFVAQTERSIDRYKMFTHDDRILVAVSGGKDSLGLWDVLVQLGYHADGLYIGLGIDGNVNYSDQSLDKARAFAEKVPNTTLHVVDVEKNYGKSIPVISREKTRGQGKPCSACGLTKRYVMNRLAAERGYNVLATGHNLDDEAAVLMQNTLHWQVGYLARQSPVLPASEEGFAKKVKPFCRFYERETATFAVVRGIDYIYDECPHAVGNLTNFYKTLLNQLETESPGAKLQFYLQFLKAREQGAFKDFNETVELHACEVCGQPTTAPGRCAFCRMWDIESQEQAVLTADQILVHSTESEDDDIETRVAGSIDISGL